MRLILKLGNSRKIVDVDSSDVDIRTLKALVANLFQLDEGHEFDLSLNGADKLNPEDETLKHFGIIGGDIVRVLVQSTHPAYARLSAGSAASPSVSVPMDVEGEVTHGASSFDGNKACNSLSSSTVMEDIGSATTSSEREQENLIEEKCVCEPLLLSESTCSSVSPTLLHACDAFKPTNSHEYVLVVLHVLMKELGFKLETEDSKWRINGALRLNYSHFRVPGALFQILLVPVSTLSMCYGTVRINEDILHKTRLQLKTSEFVNECLSDDLLARYKTKLLPKLSILFKDFVGLALLQHALRETGEQVLANLDSVVYEIQLRILKLLDVASIAKLSQCCQSLHDVCQDVALWRHLYLKNFGRRQETSLSQNWKNLYKEEHLLRKRRRPIGAHFYTPPQITPPDFFSPAPIAPPFMIGGDFDLRPNFGDPFGFHDPFAFGPRNFHSNQPSLPRGHFPYPPSAHFDSSLQGDGLHLPPLNRQMGGRTFKRGFHF